MEWIQELFEDLDVFIVQRDFEGVVDLLDKLNYYLEDKFSFFFVKELRVKVDERVRQFIEVLVFEFFLDRFLRGGFKVIRRVVF